MITATNWQLTLVLLQIAAKPESLLAGVRDMEGTA